MAVASSVGLVPKLIMTQNRLFRSEMVLGVICRVLYFEVDGLGLRSPLWLMSKNTLYRQCADKASVFIRGLMCS